MTETYRCPAYRPARTGTSVGVCEETGLGESRLTRCPIRARNCEAITREEAQGTPGFLESRKEIQERRAKTESNLIG